MTRPSTPPILSELRSSSPSANQVAALRALKNDIVGHEQRKELWISLGILAPIARILNANKPNGKKRVRDFNRNGHSGKSRTSRSDEEEARLQAIIVVGSFANGGLAYLPPLNASSVLDPILSALSPLENSSQIVLSALRTINAVADALPLQQTSAAVKDEGLPDSLYTEEHLAGIGEILKQASSSLIVQQQNCLAAALISKTCSKDIHRDLLVKTGVLDALVARLAAFVEATGCSFGGGNEKDNGLAYADLRKPQCAKYGLAPILEAIAAIIEDSKLRTVQFLHAPSFTAVFPRLGPSTSSFDRSVVQEALNPGFICNRQVYNNPIDTLLPGLPAYHTRNSLAPPPNFPPLGAIGTSAKTCHSIKTLLNPDHAFDFMEDEEHPLVPWLMFIVREEVSLTRLMAATVLTLLFRSGLTSRRREIGFALLLVPLLVRMLDKDPKISQSPSSSYDAGDIRSPESIIRAQAPALLAMLIMDSTELQQAAADAGAIKKLSLLLKDTYEPLPARYSGSLWTYQPSETSDTAAGEESTECKLGPTGLSSKAYHIMVTREAALIALGAMATIKDDYRKVIIENGVVPLVIESLKPQTSTSSNFKGSKSAAGPSSAMTASVANSSAILVAACGAARGLTRSVSTLRTSLIDAGLAPPVFTLLRHHDMKVQVAATAVICNLMLEFSPMRDAIIKAGVLQVLCEHAHSMNSNLRLNSIWALKHLVYTAPNSLKMKCLEELGPGWLQQIIYNDAEEIAPVWNGKAERDIPGGKLIAMGTSNAAGEQVDLLNAVEKRSRGDNEDTEEDYKNDINMSDSIGLDKSETSPSQSHPFLRLDPSRTPAISYDAGLVPIGKHRSEDTAVQEQGLDFVRNLVMGEGNTEMVDYIFRELGQDRFFDMLAAKLRPRVLNAFNRNRRSSENGVRHTPPATEIIVSVIYIIVHIAASCPRHRQLLISNSELLKLMLPLYSHLQRDVRVACAWLVINLTWIDNQADQANCRSRAHELVTLGFYQKLETLESDSELDVRERAKTALHQMGQLLRH